MVHFQRPPNAREVIGPFRLSLVHAQRVCLSVYWWRSRRVLRKCTPLLLSVGPGSMMC